MIGLRQQRVAARVSVLVLGAGLLALSLADCGDRELRVSFYTPGVCCRRTDGGVPLSSGLICSDCPMENLSSIQLTIERTTGEVVRERCLPAPSGLCDYEDLRGLKLIEGIEPYESIDLRLEGFHDADCKGKIYFRCESPGQGRYLVDLREEGFPVDLWCSCAPLPLR